ncbi:serine/threonine protein kinase [bacterium]|nr:serine/threonine protein kinase [bacterium]
MESTGRQKRPTLADIISNSTFIGRFKILELLGEGATGKVYKIRETSSGKIFALKLIKNKMVANPSVVMQFRQESDIGYRLNHENIATIYEFGLRPNAYVILDYYDGESLSKVISKNGNLSVDRSVNIFEQICYGLEHAHQKGVVHCDIKPENILLIKCEKKGECVKIVDFGISELKVRGEFRSVNLEPEKEFFGSPLYASPEQIRLLPTDPRSDIYSLGCLMYKTLTGVQPIDGDDLKTCLVKHLTLVPLKFAEVNPDLNIDKELENIVQRCMAKEVENRFQSARDVSRALRIYRARKSLGII